MPVVTGDRLIERAEALLPAIAARALEAERQRRIPQETIEDIRAAGLNRVMRACRWGGFGLDFDVFFEISWRLASACGSTGWVYSQSAVQNWQIGLASPAAQADYYSCPDTFSCSAFNPRGAKVEQADGGWMVSGRWQYSSGCYHADWALLGAVLPGVDGPALLLIPRKDFQIDDTWHVSGLRATGSNDVFIDRPVFVPGHRYISPTTRLQPGHANYRRGAYGMPPPSLAPWAIVAPSIGMAQGALNAYEATTRTRRAAFGGQAMSDMAGPQFRISEASAKLDTARALARADIGEAITRGTVGDEPSAEDRVRFRRNHAYIVDLCYDATMLIARGAGAGSLFETNPIQRFMRDAHAGAMQIAVNWDEQAESYGRVRMGLSPSGLMW